VPPTSSHLNHNTLITSLCFHHHHHHHQSIFGFGSNAKINVKLTGYEDRLKRDIPGAKGASNLLPIYESHEVRRRRRRRKGM